jgi:hypothetical protein
MVPLEALKVGCHGSRDFLRILYLQKVAHDLSVVGGLPGQALNRITLPNYLALAHDLDFLGWLGSLFEGARPRGHGTVYQL